MTKNQAEELVDMIWGGRNIEHFTGAIAMIAPQIRYHMLALHSDENKSTLFHKWALFLREWATALDEVADELRNAKQ